MKNGDKVRFLVNIIDDLIGVLPQKLANEGEEAYIIDMTAGDEIYPILVAKNDNEFFVKESEIEAI